jgi:hypothetical protein
LLSRGEEKKPKLKKLKRKVIRKRHLTKPQPTRKAASPVGKRRSRGNHDNGDITLQELSPRLSLILFY